MNLITLTTDFGLNDWFVGSMKGAIVSIHPSARLIDISHGVPSGDIAAGALSLMASCRTFPPKTIHLAVVDPGVGSARQPIAVRSKDYFFVGPDNGLLSLALAEEKIEEIRLLDNKKLFRPTISATFHGRDIFAPVAAHLSKGVPFQELGPKLDSYLPLDMQPPVVEVGRIRGRVIYIDRFGNAITNITLAHLGDIPPNEVEVIVAGRKRIKFGRYYQEVAKGQPISLIDSGGFLEVAVNRGDAAKQLRLKKGAIVVVNGSAR